MCYTAIYLYSVIPQLAKQLCYNLHLRQDTPIFRITQLLYMSISILKLYLIYLPHVIHPVKPLKILQILLRLYHHHTHKVPVLSAPESGYLFSGTDRTSDDSLMLCLIIGKQFCVPLVF